MTKKQTKATFEDTMTLKLKKPLEGNDGESIIVLELCEPTAHQLDKMLQAVATGTDVTGTIEMIALMTGIDRVIIRDMVLTDLMKASKFLENFTGDGQPTGQN